MFRSYRVCMLATVAACLASVALCVICKAQAPTAVPVRSSQAAIVKLACTVRPSARQLAWQATGSNAFVHFGMNTFSNREWGDGTEKPAAFAPTEFDANQWATTFRNAGMNGIVLTCKHHDGFCLWPSDTTDHDVAASPFRDGLGDVVAEVANACKQQSLKFGVYLSPWDRNQKTFGTKAYQAVFLAQLTELLSNYGELFEVWFDGAHSPPDDPSLFDWQAVFQLVRKLQPNAVIAITGPDVRWVGNEAGQTRDSEWSVLPLPQEAPGAFEQDRQSWRSLWELRGRNQASDLGSRSELSKAKALCWWPAETDVSIRPGWFYHPEDDQRVKPLKTLLDYWFTAVGGNAVLLLNVPADRRGLIAAPDVAVLKDVGNYLNATFANNLARSATARHEGREVHFEQPVTVDLFDLAEDIAVTGQRVEQFYVDVMREGAWQECATGTTIGFRRLLRTEPITGTAFRVRITKQRGPASIKDFGLFLRPTLMQAPTIGRNKNGAIAITAGQLAVRYTIDGSTVTDTSPLYSKPFALPMGGTVRARATASNDSNTVVLGTATETSASFGLSPVGWKIVACSSEQGGDEPASNAIDGNPNTLWHTRYQPDTPSHPHYLTIDLGQTHTLTGFLYQPRTTGNNGTIADYEFHGSHDGVQWTELAKGTFGNIGNNPIARTVPFEKAAQNTRFVRFTALREVAGRAWASVGELSVLAGPEVKNK